MIRKLMLALAMAALMSFALAGTAFAQLLEQDAAAGAVGGAGGAGGDAVNAAEVNQANVFAQSNVAEQDQDQAAYVKGYKNEVAQVAVAEIAQANVAENVAQVNAAEVNQTATGGAGGAGGDAEAIAANAVLVDIDLDLDALDGLDDLE